MRIYVTLSAARACAAKINY